MLDDLELSTLNKDGPVLRGPGNHDHCILFLKIWVFENMMLGDDLGVFRFQVTVDTSTIQSRA